ncbi:unnamed protein product [Caenorhabditis sp. 36 PRJEB53466]|nr:unnamed protein product [Caenorhabditis sp. 36 PRJEB53466]
MEERNVPTIRELSDQLKELPMYAPLRTYIRGTVNVALGVTKRLPAKFLTDKECVAHSLIADWIDSSGYKIAAQMMRTQMAEKYVDAPQQYVTNGDSIDKKLTEIEMNVPKLERKERSVENGHPSRVNKRRGPLRIAPAISSEDFRKSMMTRVEMERKMFPRKAVIVHEPSDSEDSSSSSEEEKSQEEKASNKEVEDEEEEEETTKPWTPSKLALVTDEVSDPPSSIFSAHLPPLSISKPLLTTKEEKAIDALFEDDYDLGDFDDDVEDETNKKKETEVEQKKEDKKEEQKAVAVEPLVLSEGESIDELEEFDTGLLSSGGSDYSF